MKPLTKFKNTQFFDHVIKPTFFIEAPKFKFWGFLALTIVAVLSFWACLVISVANFGLIFIEGFQVKHTTYFFLFAILTRMSWFAIFFVGDIACGISEEKN
jgi:hypothetical protein